jgi:CRISPR/Cas system-associated exonuclease Cas4 (RecB family)
MSTRAPALPPPIDSVLVPSSFSVSTLVSLERCALSVLGTSHCQEVRADGVLVPHPKALLGTILHHARAEVREGRWGDARDPLDAFRSVFQTALTSAEDELREELHTANLVPLRVAVGRREWLRRVGQGERWASSLDHVVSSREHPRTLGPLLAHARPTSGATPAVRLGAEESLLDAELRLKGRPDWSEQCGPDLVVVSEFKSGRIVDDDGVLLEEHVVQVQAYALMLERAKPGIRVDAYIEGAERVPVHWGGPQRERLLERLRALDARLPHGRQLVADDLASPGSHCRFCRIRPVCSRYLRDVPSCWPDLAGAVLPLPLDVWGVVEHVEQKGAGASLRLTDAGGRRVLVEGLVAEGMIDVMPGDDVWFFNLESSEDLDQHGAKVQPRNFHQVPPGPRWALARRLQVFLGRQEKPHRRAASTLE